ncbi:MAG: DUF6089 family protein [Bacteroidota bacterium]
MFKFITSTITFAVVIATTSATIAQTRLGIFAGGGFDWYYGDMNDRIISHPDLIKNYWTAGLLYRPGDRFHFGLSYAKGNLTSADSLAVQDFQKRRNLHFQTELEQASFHINYRPLRNARRAIPYFIAGVSYFRFDPVAEYGGQEIRLQPLGTEGQYIDGSDNPEPYKLYRLSAPLGIGVEVPLSCSFALRIEAVNHLTFFDFLDDLSTDYADSTALSATPNGTLAVELASNLPDGYPAGGFKRGNEDNNDTYFFFGATLLYTPCWKGSSTGRGPGPDGPARLGRKKRKNTCPAYQ